MERQSHYGYSENVDQRLDRHKNIGGNPHWDNVSVSDCRKRIDAEKKRPIKWVTREAARGGLKRVRPARHKGKREQCVDRDIRRREKAEQL